MKCAKCDSWDVKLLDTRILWDAKLLPTRVLADRRQRWRRYECKRCSDRWTVYGGKDLPKDPARPPKSVTSARRVSNAAAAEIILSDRSALALAAEHGVSAQAIWQIRHGKSYADVYTRLKEQGYSISGFGEKLCRDCRYWQEDGCDFRFPDAGADFATDCYLYARAKETRLLQ